LFGVDFVDGRNIPKAVIGRWSIDAVIRPSRMSAVEGAATVGNAG
jgi:hypothetical protein